MGTLVIVVHIISCLFLILFVLLQAGRGAEVGATFGGLGQTYFGSQSGNILTKITTVLALLFMVTSIALTVLQHKEVSTSVMDKVVQSQTTQTAPAATTPAPANTENKPAEKK